MTYWKQLITLMPIFPTQPPKNFSCLTSIVKSSSHISVKALFCPVYWGQYRLKYFLDQMERSHLDKVKMNKRELGIKLPKTFRGNRYKTVLWTFRSPIP